MTGLNKELSLTLCKFVRLDDKLQRFNCCFCSASLQKPFNSENYVNHSIPGTTYLCVQDNFSFHKLSSCPNFPKDHQDIFPAADWSRDEMKAFKSRDVDF